MNLPVLQVQGPCEGLVGDVAREEEGRRDDGQEEEGERASGEK